MSRRTQAKTIDGPFVYHSYEMRISPAWRALPYEARHVLDQLEVEHMAHGGSENGRLIRTYTQFANEGLRRSSIALAIRQAAALGFLRVTNSGQKSQAQFRNTSQYELTYVMGRGKSPAPTHDWRKVADAAEACARLATAAAIKRLDTQAAPAERNREAA